MRIVAEYMGLSSGNGMPPPLPDNSWGHAVPKARVLDLDDNRDVEWIIDAVNNERYSDLAFFHIKEIPDAAIRTMIGEEVEKRRVRTGAADFAAKTKRYEELKVELGV